MLIKFIENRWPSNRSQVPEIIEPYFRVADELNVINEFGFKGNRLVVASNLRKEMLAKIHYLHLGIVKSKNRAREILYWSNMNKQIGDLVSKCVTCISH